MKLVKFELNNSENNSRNTTPLLHFRVNLASEVVKRFSGGEGRGVSHITEKLATKIIIWTGTLTAVVIHIVWFSLWFFWKLDVNLLTNLVSLEAIFLAIFVLIAQNQQSQQMHAHHETTKQLHRKLDEKLKQL